MESTPLPTAHGASDLQPSSPPSQPLNPQMVYVPSGSPAVRSEDGDDDEPLAKWRFNMVVFTRLLVLVFSLIDITLQYVADFRRASFLVANIVVWLVFLWNFYVLIPRNVRGDGPKMSVPKIGCMIGGWKFYLCGDGDDEYEDVFHQGVEAARPRRKKTRPQSPRFVDFFLGSLMLLFTIVTLLHQTGRTWRYRDGYQRESIGHVVFVFDFLTL